MMGGKGHCKENEAQPSGRPQTVHKDLVELPFRLSAHPGQQGEYESMDDEGDDYSTGDGAADPGDLSPAAASTRGRRVSVERLSSAEGADDGGGDGLHHDLAHGV